MIRNFQPGDWQALQEVIVQYQASESAKYEDPWPTADADMQGITGWFAGGDNYLAVCLKDTGKIIGFVAIEPREGHEERVHNLGYIFHPGYQGQGYATESCRAAMAYLFTALEAAAILTGTKLENESSVQLLKRLGLSHVGNGEFTITKEQWLALGQASAQEVE